MQTDILGTWSRTRDGIEDTVSIGNKRLTYWHGGTVQYAGGYSVDQKTSRIVLNDGAPAELCDYFEYSANQLYGAFFNDPEGTKKLEYVNINDIDPYLNCPTFETDSFVLRLVEERDSDPLFECYNDKSAVALMNEDNCDFGFYVKTKRQMSETVAYWLDFYAKRGFVRFSVVDNAENKAIGTVEGFAGDTGVLRIDLCAAYEKSSYIGEILELAKKHFRALFGNHILVTKAIPQAAERRRALADGGWEYIGRYRGYGDYYETKLDKTT